VDRASATVGLAILTLTGVSAGAQQSASASSYTIVGRVTDSAQRPVLGAEVSLELRGEVLARVRSSANGRFEFTNAPRRATLISVRRLGYHPYSETLPVGFDVALRELSLVLRAAVIDVAPVVVEERMDRSSGRLREFYQHKRANPLGVFIEREDIERREVGQISELLRSMRGVQVTASQAGGNRVRLRGCRPTIWLNGLRVMDAEVDDVAHPADIDAIEIYLSIAGMPARFVDPTERCGAVAVWTSDGEDREKIPRRK
jgi:hypothetical protein